MKFYKTSSKPNGFTLIELIVVVGIMLVLVSVAIANFISFNERQKLVLAARQLQLYIRTAQLQAQTKPTSELFCSGSGESIQGFSLTSSNTGKQGTQITISGLCGTSPQDITGTASTLQDNSSTTYIDSTLTLTTPLDLEFYTLGKGGRINSPANGTIILQGPSQSISFTVSPEGGVSEGLLFDTNTPSGPDIGGDTGGGDQGTGPVVD